MVHTSDNSDPVCWWYPNLLGVKLPEMLMVAITAASSGLDFVPFVFSLR